MKHDLGWVTTPQTNFTEWNTNVNLWSSVSYPGQMEYCVSITNCAFRDYSRAWKKISGSFYKREQYVQCTWHSISIPKVHHCQYAAIHKWSATYEAVTVFSVWGLLVVFILFFIQFYIFLTENIYASLNLKKLIFIIELKSLAWHLASNRCSITSVD